MPDTAVVGLSRRGPEGECDWLTANLSDPAGLHRALATQPSITPTVYAARAAHGESGMEDVPAKLVARLT